MYAVNKLPFEQSDEEWFPERYSKESLALLSFKKFQNSQNNVNNE